MEAVVSSSTPSARGSRFFYNIRGHGSPASNLLVEPTTASYPYSETGSSRPVTAAALAIRDRATFIFSGYCSGCHGCLLRIEPAFPLRLPCRLQSHRNLDQLVATLHAESNYIADSVIIQGRE